MQWSTCSLVQQILVALQTSIWQFIFPPFLCLLKDLEVILEIKHSYSNCRLSGTPLTSFPAPQFNVHTQAGTSPHTPHVHTPCRMLTREWWQWALHVLNYFDPVKMTGTYGYPEGRGHLFVGRAPPFLCVGCSHCHKYGNTALTKEKGEVQRVPTTPQSKISALFLLPPKLLFSCFCSEPCPLTHTL